MPFSEPIQIGSTMPGLAQGAFLVGGAANVVAQLSTGLMRLLAGALIFGAPITVATPTADGHAATKAYVDALVTTAGIGLTKTGASLALGDANLTYDSIGQMSLGGTAIACRLTLRPTASGFVSYHIDGSKSNAYSLGEIQPSNSGGPFTFNASGTTAGFQFIDNDSVGRVGYNQVYFNGHVTSRTVPLIKQSRGATPGAGAYFWQWLDSDETTELARIDKDAKGFFPSMTLSSLTSGRIPVVSTAGLLADSSRFLWATSGGADLISLNGAAALGAMNLNPSAGGYYLVMAGITHYAFNQINGNTDYSVQLASMSMACTLNEKQGPDVSSANNLVLGTGQFTSGNWYVVNGDTQTNLLSKLGFQDGSSVVLHLVPSVSMTIKHGQTTSGNNTKIILTGNADLVATAPQNLPLRLSTVGGVQAWRQDGPVLLVA